MIQKSIFLVCALVVGQVALALPNVSSLKKGTYTNADKGCEITIYQSDRVNSTMIDYRQEQGDRYDRGSISFNYTTGDVKDLSLCQDLKLPITTKQRPLSDGKIEYTLTCGGVTHCIDVKAVIVVDAAANVLDSLSVLESVARTGTGPNVCLPVPKKVMTALDCPNIRLSAEAE